MTTSTPCSSIFSSPGSVSSETSSVASPSSSLSGDDCQPQQPQQQQKRKQERIPEHPQQFLSQAPIQKTAVVDALVNSSILLLEAIWPLSINNGSLPLRTFIQETLKRSRTSYSTFQVSLYYLVRIKDKVQAYLSQKPSQRLLQINEPAYAVLAKCPRRTFLAALMVASKYLQDRNYSLSAWSKISGLSRAELTQNESRFLDAIDWRLFVPTDKYDKWSTFLLSGGVCTSQDSASWKSRLLSIHNSESGIIMDDICNVHVHIAEPISKPELNPITNTTTTTNISDLEATIGNKSTNVTAPAFVVPPTPQPTPPEEWKVPRKRSLAQDHMETKPIGAKKRRMSNHL